MAQDGMWALVLTLLTVHTARAQAIISNSTDVIYQLHVVDGGCRYNGYGVRGYHSGAGESVMVASDASDNFTIVGQGQPTQTQYNHTLNNLDILPNLPAPCDVQLFGGSSGPLACGAAFSSDVTGLENVAIQPIFGAVYYVGLINWWLCTYQAISGSNITAAVIGSITSGNPVNTTAHISNCYGPVSMIVNFLGDPVPPISTLCPSTVTTASALSTTAVLTTTSSIASSATSTPTTTSLPVSQTSMPYVQTSPLSAPTGPTYAPALYTGAAHALRTDDQWGVAAGLAALLALV